VGLAHSPRIVTDGLALALDAGNTKSYPGSGTTWTNLIGSNNGTLTNGPTFSSLNGGSIVFDGSNDYVQVSASSDLNFGTGNFTIEGWFNKGATTANLTLLCSDRFYSPFDNGTWILRISSATQIELRTFDGKGNLESGGFNASTSVDTWHHFALVREGTGTNQTKFYLDGVLKGSTTITKSLTDAGTNGLRIGEEGDPGQSNALFNGKISNVKLYKGKALTAAEVAQNYSALKERYVTLPIVQDGLILHLDAGDTNSYSGSGTTWTDLSGNSNNGTLTNGPTYSSADRGSIVFDGTDDYVSETSGLSDSFLQGDWTISFWVNFDVITTSNTSGRILLQHGSNITRSGLHLEQRNSRLHLGLYGDDLGGSQTLSASTWYNITFTVDTTTRLQQIFIDGSLDNSRTAFGVYVGTGSNTRIGGRALNFSSYLDGKISNVVAYNRVLSAQEISQNYILLKDRY